MFHPCGDGEREWLGAGGDEAADDAVGDFDTHFSLDNMRKDSAYAIELAAQAGLDTPAIEAVSRRMAELCADGMADLDYSALAKPYLAEEL